MVKAGDELRAELARVRADFADRGRTERDEPPSYTARHLAGMIARFGLSRDHLARTHNLLKAYAHDVTLGRGHEDEDRGVVHFLGLWDAVPGAYGGLTFWYHDEHHHGRLERGIKYVAHAVSLDDSRRRFRPEIYDRSLSDPILAQQFFPGSHG